MKTTESVAPSIEDLIAIHACMECEVLVRHMAHTSQFTMEIANYLTDKSFDNLEFDFANMEGIKGNIDDDKADILFEMLENFYVYETEFDRLSTKYSFPDSNQKICKMLLNSAAYAYISLNGQVWLKRTLPAFEKELEKLISAANRFRYVLKPMAEWGEGFDNFFDNQPIQKLLCDTMVNLDEIATLKDKMRSSTIGKLAKLDDHRPMRNLGLHEFIRQMWNFWHDVLGRTVVQKYDGINGRKQFLEFIVECLEPVHPTLIEGPMVDGPVDNALKKFQKNLKPS